MKRLPWELVEYSLRALESPAEGAGELEAWRRGYAFGLSKARTAVMSLMKVEKLYEEDLKDYKGPDPWGED